MNRCGPVRCPGHTPPPPPAPGVHGRQLEDSTSEVCRKLFKLWSACMENSPLERTSLSKINIKAKGNSNDLGEHRRTWDPVQSHSGEECLPISHLSCPQHVTYIKRASTPYFVSNSSLTCDRKCHFYLSFLYLELLSTQNNHRPKTHSHALLLSFSICAITPPHKLIHRRTPPHAHTHPSTHLSLQTYIVYAHKDIHKISKQKYKEIRHITLS